MGAICREVRLGAGYEQRLEEWLRENVSGGHNRVVALRVTQEHAFALVSQAAAEFGPYGCPYTAGEDGMVVVPYVVVYTAGSDRRGRHQVCVRTYAEADMPYARVPEDMLASASPLVRPPEGSDRPAPQLRMVLGYIRRYRTRCAGGA